MSVGITAIYAYITLYNIFMITPAKNCVLPKDNKVEATFKIVSTHTAGTEFNNH